MLSKFRKGTLPPSLFPSFPPYKQIFLQTTQMVMSENFYIPEPAWFAAAQPGIQVDGHSGRGCVPLSAHFPVCQNTLPVQAPELHFCCRCGQRQNFPWLQREQEHVSPSKPTRIAICCFLSVFCFPFSPICSIKDGSWWRWPRGCLHKGGNSSPGGSCFGSVAKAPLLAPADLSSAALPAFPAGCRWLSPQPFPRYAF